MHLRVSAIVIALTALLFASSCTPEEVAFYLEVTEHVNDVLSADELKRLRDCESTDNYAAVSLWTDTVGLYRGAYPVCSTHLGRRRRASLSLARRQRPRRSRTMVARCHGPSPLVRARQTTMAHMWPPSVTDCANL